MMGGSNANNFVYVFSLCHSKCTQIIASLDCFPVDALFSLSFLAYWSDILIGEHNNDFEMNIPLWLNLMK